MKNDIYAKNESERGNCVELSAQKICAESSTRWPSAQHFRSIIQRNYHFTQVGEFVPLSTDQDGKTLREVAPARIALPRPDHPGETLPLRVALIRDLRRCVAVVTRNEESDQVRRWDADLTRNEQQWWEVGWKATPTPAAQTAPKLIPIVTTADTFDAVELAQVYIHRWSAQENIIKDFLRPLGLDTNHGFAKTLVENSEMTKRRTTLEKRFANVQRWKDAAGERSSKAEKRYRRLADQKKARGDELYRALNDRQSELIMQGVADHLVRREIKERKAIADAELEQMQTKIWKAYHQCNQEFRKQEQYCKQQRNLLRALEDLKANEREMYELDHRKDQVMTVCKVALANLGMWARDHYFPASYAHATWLRLVPFFRLSGTVVRDAATVQVELHPFNDRALNRDLALLCERVNQAAPRLPDGRLLCFTTNSPYRILPAQEQGVT